jgi:hypothetical protein
MRFYQIKVKNRVRIQNIKINIIVNKKKKSFSKKNSEMI